MPEAASSRSASLRAITHARKSAGVRGYGRYDRLVGDAADSPVTRELGSRNQPSAGVASATPSAEIVERPRAGRQLTETVTFYFIVTPDLIRGLCDRAVRIPDRVRDDE